MYKCRREEYFLKEKKKIFHMKKKIKSIPYEKEENKKYSLMKRADFSF